MSPLNFCFLTTFYPPYHFGGDAVGIQRLARGLASRGHRVTVIHDVDAFRTLAKHEPSEDSVEPDGIEVVPLRSGVGLLSPLLTQQLGRPVINGARIKRLLAQGNYDVVNFHNVSLVGGPGLLRYGAPALRLYMAHEHWLVCPSHVLWRHGRERCTGRQCFRCTLHYRRPPQLWRYTGFLERQLKHVDAFIAMSEFSRRKHHEFGFPREMEVLPYFLPDGAGEEDHQLEESPHPRPYFLFVGRLERIKGLDEVIPLFQRYPEADLLIAGDGEHSAALKSLAAGSPRVKFLGRVPLDRLSAYYRHALALIVPSVCFETFGIILIEAFRHGTPVIARRLGPFPEIVEASGAGELFDSEADLLAAMRRLQGRPELRRSLGQAGRRAFRDRWSQEAVVPRYLDIVKRTAAATGRSGLAGRIEAEEAV